jgi:hypothetical protein
VKCLYCHWDLHAVGDRSDLQNIWVTENLMLMFAVCCCSCVVLPHAIKSCFTRLDVSIPLRWRDARLAEWLESLYFRFEVSLVLIKFPIFILHFGYKTLLFLASRDEFLVTTEFSLSSLPLCVTFIGVRNHTSPRIPISKKLCCF